MSRVAFSLAKTAQAEIDHIAKAKGWSRPEVFCCALTLMRIHFEAEAAGESITVTRQNGDREIIVLPS